ncbi:putative enzyme with aminotransferase class-III domain protein [Plesiocystis pacifica SIR-1]|uniref:Putative enzyme with aminotransferase class-III domain protein n=1 Tax=Plesiocystis pacifica SIR-1 TaxID=391625 RepID=A6FXA8_9BACT|nr:aminotransferase class III-fold pyridoxal phosphate-dependent enzyme [Plesiocystis pacifica]EDM81932.1 putative enzyme with aminotransferase class-III domain protein [Plesiocystis pacifica SIR-1]
MHSRPQISPERAAQLAAEWFEGQLDAPAELDSYADRNFLVRAPDGTKAVLKVPNVELAEDIDLQIAILKWLEARPSAPLVPRVLGPTRTIEDDAGRPTRAWMVGWIEGELWFDASPTPALREELGAALGQLARDLEDFRHPGMERHFAWNLAEANWIAEELHRFEDPARAELVCDALMQFQGRVLPRLAELPTQVIHGDANDKNLAVAEGRLVGVFDFGDACWCPAVCDLAIALAYAAMDLRLGCALPEVAAACAQVCAGYHGRRPLTALELDLLYDLLRARLAVSVTSSTRAREAEPDNAYVSASEQGAWSVLEALGAVGRRAFTATVAEACGLALAPRVPGARTGDELLAARRRRLGPSLSLSYASSGMPLYIRRGEGSWLFDEHDQAFLDCVNNVCHVGHCHPRVVEAGAAQMARLNTNTRYLHEGLVDYAEALCATLPAPLEVVYLVNSGSEANELALRLARDYTGGFDVAVLDAAYHGNTGNLVDMSPYKFDAPGGRGRREWVHVLPTPDPYRGAHGDDGPAYAAALDAADAAARGRGSRLAALFCESVLGCAGQVVPASGFLAAAYARARAAGAVCIADEVQVGFGRVGDGMWAFEAEGVVPDILTLGKPIGNGHPLGAVVTTRAIAEALGGGRMEFFCTFGGNPVSAAVGAAVLAVIEDEGLVANARDTGSWLRGAFEQLAADPVLGRGIGEVRGRGLFIGVELVEDRSTKRPDAARASAIVAHARARGVLLSTDGPARNVIKIKPPICFADVEARILASTLARALSATMR